MTDFFQDLFMLQTPTGGVLLELRKVSRYALGATAVLTWQDESGIQQRAEGITRDISTEGTFIYAVVCPPEQVPILMELSLPPLREETGPLRMLVKGRVVRVEEHKADPPQSGFAVTGKLAMLGGGEEENAEKEDC